MTFLCRRRRILCRRAGGRGKRLASSEPRRAQLSAKALPRYKTICFKRQRMRRLVLFAARYDPCR
ncbi:hypothetical protein EN925_01695 [Mesorhizobium sp. M7A.F.Ca.US.006.04.2.1]|nr:hypothetical protein EN990_08920 [Mesorhizobium sp. M7A.F.Ca.US.005.03.1.1]RUY18693.1 hypothetical protein EN991_03275 [Mesorhizobium sp. M7A.F.Ca.US.005.03.2.1]RUY24473.1 hypothetical protein EN979_26015 [Mesorhizobium sp. M7A.F.Ca.US.001.04.2.1]RUY40097.1 hypothetical protein EN978_19345 [Mesorhizobium sp. M7A.F.Ca.US.001.04.1.1]RUZ02792.1 hypothetical protein EN974_04155 [Mesorhizobium sp. M7A.F.Ca.CA.001.12.2.1]RUZ28462.1 hypothetical protein EN949_06465 [Mesorhizobium sp. M7A.F.Ca.US.0